MDKFDNIKKYTIFTIIGSILIHCGVYVAALLIEIEVPVLSKPETIEIVVMEQPKPEIKKTVKVQSKKKVKMVQVVEQNDKALNDERPEDKFFLGKNNQRVQKQTVAKNHGDFKNDAGKGLNGKSKKNKAKAKKKSPKKRVADEKGSIKNFLPKYTYSTAKNFDQEQSAEGQRSQTNDYLKGIEEGKQTILNTREFVYYAYYERIRGKIRKIWEPVIREKVKHVFQSGRKLASTDHATAVIITLDKSGALVNVQVKDGSGVRDLDDAAIEAFKQAEPFPNPPNGIIESDGKIRINWNFVLEA